MTSNSISNRKDARESLYAQIAAITEFQLVQKYVTKDPQGQSPVAMIESLDQHTEATPAIMESFGFSIWVWVDRTDAASAEDLSDTLAQKITEKVLGWHNAYFSERSQTSYETLEKGQYKLEIFSVEVDWE